MMWSRTFFRAVLVLLITAAPVAAEPRFADLFSAPTEPNTLLGPGQLFELPVPKGKAAVVTDVYIHNQSGLFGQPSGTALVHLCEMRLPTSCEIRYSYQTVPGQTLVINYSSGVRFGNVAPISAIRILNDSGSGASVHPRINGYFVR
jgi:hypothetical protein